MTFEQIKTALENHGLTIVSDRYTEGYTMLILQGRSGPPLAMTHPLEHPIEDRAAHLNGFLRMHGLDD